jgi:hypothetical protein
MVAGCMKFWQATLSTPIRMRVSPSPQEMVQDSLDFSEMCRVNNLAGSDDLFIWMGKICLLPALGQILAGPVHPPRSLFVQTLDRLKLSWKGQKLTCGQSLWLCSQYVRDEGLKDAWLALVGIAPGFNTLDKLFRMLQAGEAWTGEKGGEVLSLMIWAWQSCHNLILFREILEKDCTVLGLVGRGKGPGLLQAMFVKRDLATALNAVYTENRVKAGLEVGGGGSPEVWVKLGTPMALKQHFAPPVYHPKLSEDWEEDEEEPHSKNGIQHYCKDQYEEWLKTLTEPMDSTLAELLFGLHGKRWDDLVEELATNASNQLPADRQRAITAALHGGTGAKTDLQQTFEAFQEAYQSKPILAQEWKYKYPLLCKVGPDQLGPPTAAGQDSTHADGGDEVEQAERKDKQEVAAKLSTWRHQQVAFLCPEEGDMDFGEPTALNTILQRTTFQKERMKPNHKRAWLIPLDLCPPLIQAWAAERKDKDFFARHVDFARQEVPGEIKKLLTWIFSVRTADRDWVILFDGRFKQVRKVWDDCVEKAHVDMALLEDLHLSYNDYVEGDFRTPARRLAFGSNKCEKVYLAMPNVKRSSLAASPRSDFNQCGEESSFETQYSGIEMRSLAEIPMLTPEDSLSLGPPPLEQTTTNLRHNLEGAKVNQTISRGRGQVGR